MNTLNLQKMRYSTSSSSDDKVDSASFSVEWIEFEISSSSKFISSSNKSMMS